MMRPVCWWTRDMWNRQTANRYSRMGDDWHPEMDARPAGHGLRIARGYGTRWIWSVDGDVVILFQTPTGRLTAECTFKTMENAR